LQVKVADAVNAIGEEGGLLESAEQVLKAPEGLSDRIDRGKGYGWGHRRWLLSPTGRC
jgi:hypothetical protein